MAELLSDLRSVRRAARTVTGRLGEEAVDGVESACKHLLHRLDLGVDHTVVVILGGTGCGKSSLFNALAGMEFAEVGAIRPTTSRPAVCVWGDGTDRLLRWLGVERDMWIQRDSTLEEHIKELRGLILVDLPDIDSIAPGHCETVNELIPLADMLVWVTDPVKYADRSLHARYLTPMREHEGSMVVVLNRVDTLQPADAASVLEDLTAQLARDGLTQAPVLATSAVMGQGVEELRGLLARATRSRTTSVLRAATQLREVASGLRNAVGQSTEPIAASREWVESAQAEAVEALRAFCGAAAAVDALAAGLEPVSVAPPGMDQVRVVLLTWLQCVLDRVPPPWGPAIGHTLASSQNICARLSEAMDGVSPGPRPSWLARLMRRGQVHRERSLRFDLDVCERLTAVVSRTMTAPTLAVLEDWAATQATLGEVLSRAQGPGSRSAESGPRGATGGPD
jgi:GTP-binding protein EngB required for normal cell division